MKIEKFLRNKNISGKTITLKVKYDNFEQITRSRSLKKFIQKGEIVFDTAKDLLESTDVGKRKVRLLGLTISNLNDQRKDGLIGKQLEFPFKFTEGIIKGS